MKWIDARDVVALIGLGMVFGGFYLWLGLGVALVVAGGLLMAAGVWGELHGINRKDSG